MVSHISFRPGWSPPGWASSAFAPASAYDRSEAARGESAPDAAYSAGRTANGTSSPSGMPLDGADELDFNIQDDGFAAAAAAFFFSSSSSLACSPYTPACMSSSRRARDPRKLAWISTAACFSRLCVRLLQPSMSLELLLRHLLEPAMLAHLKLLAQPRAAVSHVARRRLAGREVALRVRQ